MDTLFQFNKLNEKKATQPRKGGGRVRIIRYAHIVGQLFVDLDNLRRSYDIKNII